MDRPLEVGSQFGIDPDLWNRNWAELSGGEGQRIMMATGVALGAAEVLLLDGEVTPLPPPPFLSPPCQTLLIEFRRHRFIIGSDATFFSLFLTWSRTSLFLR